MTVVCYMCRLRPAERLRMCWTDLIGKGHTSKFCLSMLHWHRKCVLLTLRSFLTHNRQIRRSSSAQIGITSRNILVILIFIYFLCVFHVFVAGSLHYIHSKSFCNVLFFLPHTFLLSLKFYSAFVIFVISWAAYINWEWTTYLWQGITRHRFCECGPCGALRLTSWSERVHPPCRADGSRCWGHRQGLCVCRRQAGFFGKKNNGKKQEGPPATRLALCLRASQLGSLGG